MSSFGPQLVLKVLLIITGIRMNLFDQACKDANFMQDMKLRRGYGELYHLILQQLGFDIPLVELGVGGGTSHARWTYAVAGPVIGIEIAGPEKEYCTASIFTGDPNIADRQVEIAKASAELFFGLPRPNQERLDIRYYTDAFDPKTASALLTQYKHLPLIINDSKHAPHLHRVFRETWEHTVSDSGILVQEDIARWVNDCHDMEFEEPKAKELVKALNDGWQIYQFVDYDLHNDGEADSRASLIGVYFTDPKWHAILKPLEHRKVTHDNYLDFCTGE